MASQHGKMIEQAARKRAGAGWDLLGAEIQEALIAREAMHLILGQAEETMAKNPALARFCESYREALGRAGL